MTALEFARENGFEGVAQSKPRNGRRCWAAVYRESESINDLPMIGFPQYIVETGDGFRFLDYDEAMDQVRKEDE